MQKQIAVVQHYINVRKEKTVQIKIETPQDALLLQLAYTTALNWFQANNLKIELLDEMNDQSDSEK